MEYHTEPPIPYERFLESKAVTIGEPPRVVYVMPHKTVFCNGSYLYVFKGDQGEARFERFGRNDIHNVFPAIIAEHGVKVFDECGLEYPDCYD